MTEERLQKILAQAGFGSRRFCETLIEQGRVKVNGQLAELGQKSNPVLDKIDVDGTRIPRPLDFRYVMLNKPRFVLCDKTTVDDRKTVFNLIPDGSDLAVVGRLDFESEGMVILTNDGAMVNQLTHPKYQHEKEYRVLVATHPDQKQLDIWRRGVVLEDGHRTAQADVRLESVSGKGAWIRIVLKEGHKRQIREMAKVTGLFIVKLMRVRIGNLNLGTLKAGEFRNLSKSEIEGLRTNPKPPRPLPRVNSPRK